MTTIGVASKERGADGKQRAAVDDALRRRPVAGGVGGLLCGPSRRLRGTIEKLRAVGPATTGRIVT
jgi:hypothetical protein